MFLIILIILLALMCSNPINNSNTSNTRIARITGGGYLARLYEKHKSKKQFTLEDEPGLKYYVEPSPQAKHFTFTPVSIYSMTHPADAKKINKVIQKMLNVPLKTLIITDATACVGGNSLIFAQDFKQVNSVEIDENNFDALTKNAKLYDLKNINIYHDDYLNIMNSLQQDVIFADPPWGGLDYKSATNLELYMSNMNIKDIISHFNKTHIFIKVPKIFNIANIDNSNITEFKTFLLIYFRPT